MGEAVPFAFVCGLTPVSLAFGRMLLPCTLVLLARALAKAYPCLARTRHQKPLAGVRTARLLR